MAKRYRTISDITNLTYKEFNSMTTEDARNALRAARGFAIQRERKFTEAIEAYEVRRDNRLDYFEFGHTRFTTPLNERVNLELNEFDATRAELIHELVGYKTYLKLSTNTKYGAEARERQIIRDVYKASGFQIPKNRLHEFFEAYKQISDQVAESSVGGRYEMWRKIGEMMEQQPHIQDYEDFKRRFIDKEFPTSAPADADLTKEKAKFYAAWDDISDDDEE